MSNQLVKRKELEACMTCPICKKLFRDATTISECLHTFCRKCIDQKLSDEELNCCPVCEIDLGCTPLEKMRLDHNIQELRAKIFPLERREVKAPETVPSVTLPVLVRRKERSFWLEVVKFSTLGIWVPFWNSSAAESSSVILHDKETENGEEGVESESSDLWKPLGFLAEVANRSKSSSSSSKPKKVRRNRQKKAAAASSGEPIVSPQPVLDSAINGGGLERKTNQIWFSLVASQEQEGHKALPQIPANYLRIKDVNMPVSCVQKYLMSKLGLTSEDEVEIKLMGQSIAPTLQMKDLVELWIQRGATPERSVTATVGSSAKDFVMVLNYCRKVVSSS